MALATRRKVRKPLSKDLKNTKLKKRTPSSVKKSLNNGLVKSRKNPTPEARPKVGSKRKADIANEDENHNGRRLSKRLRVAKNVAENSKPSKLETAKISMRKMPKVKPSTGRNLSRAKKQRSVLENKVKVSADSTKKKARKQIAPKLKRNNVAKKLVVTSPLPNKKKTPKAIKTTTSPPKKKRLTKNALTPRDFITDYKNDPTFETRESIPHVSTLAHSRLLIRAINLNDTKLLKSLLSDKKSICSLTVPRSLNINRDALSYAIEKQNMEAIKILLDSKMSKDLGSFPDVIITEVTTGQNSTVMLGHAVRKVCVGRGGKEGNDALLKDTHVYNNYNQSPFKNISLDLTRESFAFDLTKSFIQNLSASLPEQQASIYNNYLGSLVYAMRAGHHILAGELVEEALNKGGYGFNNLHKEVLLHTNEPLSPFKSVSVIKKAIYNDRITPLHCAAVNPNSDYLSALLHSRPDYSSLDTQNWSVIHYAAVCTGTGPLKLLLSRGISSSQVNKDGNTPLHLAAARGRIDNVKLILQNEEKENENDDFEDIVIVPKDVLHLANKVGQTPLHRAAEAGHSDIVSILLTAGADPNKFTPARHDKLTPFMLAARQGHVNVLKAFVAHGYMKINAVDHKGRSALVHAIINGQAHVVSYLLRIGAHNLTKDTSGNTLVHYAAAYGWYFCVKLLLDSGCPPNEPNDWKMTPLAISFMKGHMGLVEYILKQQNVDIDARVNDNTGNSLLHQAVCSKPTKEYLSRLKFLIVDQKANCNVVDFEGNNAFHYLVLTEKSEMSKVVDYKSSECQKIIFQATKLLWNNKCNPFARNSSKQTAPFLAVQYGCFSILNHMYDLSSDMPEEPNITGDNLLHLMVNQAHSEDLILFCKRLANDASNVEILKRMAVAYNKDGYTPLLELLNRVTSTHHSTATNIIHFIEFLVHTLNSDVAAVDRVEKSAQSVTHLATSVGYAEEALKVILTKGPQLEVLNYNLQTPLTYAIVKSNEMAAAVLLNHGADVNVQMTKINSLLLLHTVGQNKSFHLVPLMIDRGANIHEVNVHTKNSVLHYVCRKPHLPFAIESLRKLVEKKIDLDAVNKDGRTALHLAVNFRAGETDTSYDVEDLLIESKAKLNVRDHRGRMPLHMAFVKIGKHADSSFMDPIELVTTLVRAMKHSLPNFADEIRAVDEFGMTPLHYAAYRGATISCSYLLMEMNESIDIFDKNGNTPFGLAVLNGHEGCALQFQQKGANFINFLNTNLTQLSVNEGDHTNDAWVWTIDRKKKEEQDRKRLETENYPILQEVVSKDWQGILHLMLEKLNNSGAGATFPIAAAIKTSRLKLARKLSMRARPSELHVNDDGETLIHTLAKNVARKDDVNNREQLSQQIVNVLISKGISYDAQDRNQSTALLCAAANRNLIVCNLLGQRAITSQNGLSAFTQTDSFGRNAFSALFWNMDGETEFPAALRIWAEDVLDQGANANDCCRYPIVYPVDYPGVRFLPCETNGGSCSSKYTPLMMAVIAGNYTIVEWLLTMVNTRFIDVNCKDDDGHTALVHAVKLNDLKMARLIINPYEGRRIKAPSAQKKGRRLIFNLMDNKGWTVFDHVVAVHDGNNFYYANTDELVKVLHRAGAKFNDESGDGVSPLQRAITMKRFHLVKCMEELLKMPAAQRTTLTAEENIELYGSNSGTNLHCLALITDYERDCQMEMENVMEVEDDDSDDDDGIDEPDDLITEKHFKVMLDADQQVHYSCCLTKVDISYGFYGLYNFYKMQLLQQDRGKELIVLFTRWGRVGDEGQYQRTPFPSIEQAMKEFKKIFQSKTGNAWDTLNEFTPKPNKYRLVEMQTKRIRWPGQVNIDFAKLQRTNNIKKTTLPLSLVKLIENMVMAHKVDVKFSDFDEEFQNNMLGKVSIETLKKGSDLLEQVEELIRKRDELKQKHDYSVINEANFMESVLKPCEEFYSLIPVYGFSKEKLKPMFTMDELRQKQKAIRKLIHLEFATKLIFAAQYNLNAMNPFEYVFRCLNIKIEVLVEDDEEAQLILQYIRNTSTHPEYHSDSTPPKIHRIFRLDRSGETERLSGSGIGNKHLLWHGTSAVNVLSILHRGLKVTPLEANLSGYLLGKGIYFADMFMKSQKYSHGSNPKFMFLCEVALGSIHPVKLQHWYSYEVAPLPATCHSLKTIDSKWEPDPSTTVIYKGRTMPLGRPVENLLPENEYHGLDHNEFVVFREDQVQLRYLVQYDD